MLYNRGSESIQDAEGGNCCNPLALTRLLNDFDSSVQLICGEKSFLSSHYVHGYSPNAGPWYFSCCSSCKLKRRDEKRSLKFHILPTCLLFNNFCPFGSVKNYYWYKSSCRAQHHRTDERQSGIFPSMSHIIQPTYHHQKILLSWLLNGWRIWKYCRDYQHGQFWLHFVRNIKEDHKKNNRNEILKW